MRRFVLPVFLSAALAAGLLVAPAGAEVLPHCRIVVAVDGPEMRVSFRIRDGGANEDWTVRLYRDGQKVFQRMLRTDDHGRLRFVRTYENTPGRERILATGTRVSTGRVCAVSVRV